MAYILIVESQAELCQQLVARSDDCDRLDRTARILTLFDRCVERIHVEIDDFATRPP